MKSNTMVSRKDKTSLDEPLKVLNLYAGLGGNRKLWEDVEVTAIENDPETARFYQDHFPDDTVIITDAHQYLLAHFREFSFIWSSPPCPTHSILARTNHGLGRPPQYPNMVLYEEIIFLNQWAKGKFLVENVVPYYQPLIVAQALDRHLFWSNFNIIKHVIKNKKKSHEQANIRDLSLLFEFNLSGYKLKNKRQSLRNCVHPEIGLHILNCARGVISQENVKQEVMSFE